MTSTDVQSDSVVLLMVGDSDIERWPCNLYPTTLWLAAPANRSATTVCARGGATMEDIIPFLQTALEQALSQHSRSATMILVACAGENDIGLGTLDDTLHAFQRFCRTYFSDGSDQYMLFLGPKLEPWLDDDHASRKQYVKLNKALGRACDRHEHSDRIIYIDCLTMFCGDTANIPGALLGGKAKADPKYFVDDQLHLSDDGYRIWKDVVERKIVSILPRATVTF